MKVLSQKKTLRTLMIDREFQSLIRPLYKNEYLQLEANLIIDGCREPIVVWNGIIIDGHNRYRICQEHEIPFPVEEKSFDCREEAIAWICANQLGRRNLSEETRRFLIGKQYESEKIVNRKKALLSETVADSSVPSSRLYGPRDRASSGEIRKKTAERIAEEHHISHGTVEKYAAYAKAINEINRKEPIMAGKILSGRYKVSHTGVLSLAKRSAKELQDMNRRLEHSPQSFAKYQTTRREIQATSVPGRHVSENRPSVKDMPAYDPDAEVIGLTLTIPSWSSSINRIAHSNLDIVSDGARLKLHHALLELQDIVNTMISAIKEDP